LPSAGPIALGGRVAAQMVQVGYNAQHQIPWHWPVPAYLVTKAIAAGAFLVLALAVGLGIAPFEPMTAIATGAIAVAFMTATTALLVYDLEQPQRFLYILRRPQWRSWLARGAIFLIGFSTLAALFTAAELGALTGLLPAGLVASARPFLLWSGVPLAIGAAIYTAFLFGQAEGRDLWQSPLLPPHLLVQALTIGSAALLVLGPLLPLGEGLTGALEMSFGIGLGIDPARCSASRNVAFSRRRAAHEISHGRHRTCSDRSAGRPPCRRCRGRRLLGDAVAASPRSWACTGEHAVMAPRDPVLRPEK
jgi:hypothetical protein